MPSPIRSYKTELAGGTALYLADLGLVSWDRFGDPAFRYTDDDEWPVFIGPDMPQSPDRVVVITPTITTLLRADVTTGIQIRLRGSVGVPADEVELKAQEILDALYPNGFPLAHKQFGLIRIGAVLAGDMVPAAKDANRRHGSMQNFRIRTRRANAILPEPVDPVDPVDPVEPGTPIEQTFPSGLPLPNPTVYTDGDPVMTFGMIVRPDANGTTTAKALRWFAAAGVTARPRIWSPTGVLLASGPAVVCVAGWNTLPLSAPFVMTPGIDAIAGVHQTGGTTYPARPDTFPIAGGSLSASLGLFNFGADALATTNNSRAAWYGVDLVADHL